MTILTFRKSFNENKRRTKNESKHRTSSLTVREINSLDVTFLLSQEEKILFIKAEVGFKFELNFDQHIFDRVVGKSINFLL